MTIRRGYCPGCPFNMNDPLTHDAYNLGCLPSVAEVSNQCRDEGKAWACHSEPEKVCCGYAAQEPKRVDFPLLHVEGVHYPMVLTPAPNAPMLPVNINLEPTP